MKYLSTRQLWIVALVASSSLVIGCGGDEKKRPDIKPFLGVWYVGQASVSVTCPPLGPQKGAFSGAVNVTAGKGTDLVMTFTDPALSGCTLGFNVHSDASAVPVAGQSCPVSAQGIMATFTASSGTFSASGTAGSVNLNGSATIVFSNTNLACTGNVTGMLSRAAALDAGTDAF